MSSHAAPHGSRDEHVYVVAYPGSPAGGAAPSVLTTTAGGGATPTGPAAQLAMCDSCEQLLERVELVRVWGGNRLCAGCIASLRERTGQ